MLSAMTARLICLSHGRESAEPLKESFVGLSIPMV